MKRHLALIFALVFVCDVCRAQDTNLGTEAQREAGRKVYAHKCVQCHGDNGAGDGIASPFFMPRPRDFTSGAYKIRTTESGALPTHDDLKKVIRNGMPYTGMPAWPGLSEDELNNVVYYLKTFNDRFADPDFAAEPIPIPKAPRSSEESAQKGRQLYEENRCADCHGVAGRGDGKSAPTLKNDAEERVRPADLTQRWTFRGGSAREDIYRTFTTGLNGTPMPSYADLIETDDRWHLVDYVYSLSRDEPDYATVVVAQRLDAEIDIDAGESIFADAAPAFFPLFGQVVVPGRNFHPAATGMEVRAVCNETEIAFLLTWDDMTADTTGMNDPTLTVPESDPESVDGEPVGQYTDAVAVQTPSRNMAGTAKPYFLFGDTKNAVDIWFADLGKNDGEIFAGNGSRTVAPKAEGFSFRKVYDSGRWSVIFKRSRHTQDGLSFEDGSFVPVAFSLWNGFESERGNRRAVTAWYYVYPESIDGKSNALPIAGYGILTLLVEFVVVGVVRRKNRHDHSV